MTEPLSLWNDTPARRANLDFVDTVTDLKLTWEYRESGPVLVRQAGIVELFNDGPGKTVNTQLHIGRPPNSGGRKQQRRHGDDGICGGGEMAVS